MDMGPFSRREKDRMRGDITCLNPLSPTLSLREREEKTWHYLTVLSVSIG
jgi:hypothetical protein